MSRSTRFLPLIISAAALASCAKSGDAPATDTATVSSTVGAMAPIDSPAAGTPSSATTTAGMIDPNQVTSEQLAPLGISGPAAAALVAGRPYKSMPAVDRVLARHLNEKQRDSLYARLWTPIDLNTASGEEILLIPGIGPRMRREFEEYRPYKSMDQFRREMGKYVDKTEVARLEQYVMIR